MKRIPWWEPKIEKENYEFIKGALDRNYVNQGPLVEEFEKKIAAFLGVKNAIVTTSGTVAMFLSLKALGVGKGDEVIVPDCTFIATANAVELTGAKPILVDINPENLTISIDAFKKAVNGKTKAIIPVHVTGRGADMEAILDIARKNNIFIVEDAAEALGSKHKGKYLGTWGKTGCFSFAANKTVSMGQGGLIVTDDDALAAKINALKDQGRTVKGTGGDDLHNTIGYNFRATDLQAGMGLGQFAHFEERAKRMRRNYELYSENLKSVPEVKIFKTDVAGMELPQWTDAEIERRDELGAYLKKESIDCRKYWHPIHRQLAYKLPDDDFPVSSSILPKSIWFPSAFTLTDEDVLFVCEKIKKFFLTK